MTTTLDSIIFKARTHPKQRFQNLYGLLITDSLYQSWGQLNKQAAPGIDGMTISNYQQRLPENIDRLHLNLKQKCYLNRNVIEPMTLSAFLFLNRTVNSD